MRIARLLRKEPAGGRTNRETYGFVDGDGRRISTRDDITFATGVPIPRDIGQFLFGGWYDRIMEMDVPYSASVDEYAMLAPLPSPGKIACLAFNYVDHAEEQETAAPADPVLFIKPRTALTGTGSEIRCPDFVRQLDYEVELAVVMGSACKNVDPQDAYGSVFG